MKKFLLLAILISTNAWATDYSKVEVRASITDETSNNTDSSMITKYFANGARQVQTVSCTASAFTNISVPSGAKAVLIDVGTSTDLALKGVTADTGISLDSTCPVLLPISDDPATTTLGILNRSGSAKTVKVFWL